MSALGDWVGIFALQVLVISLAEPGSRLALFGLGGIMMARLLPSVVFAPFAGIVSDRYERKHLMVMTDVVRGGLFVVIAFWHNLLILFTLTFLVECLSLVYMSAKDASLPAIVRREDLGHANQLNLLVTYGPLPFGAVVATLVTGLASLIGRTTLPEPDPIVLALLLNAVSFIVGGALIAFVRRRGRDGGEDDDGHEGVLAEFKSGVDYIRRYPLIRSLIIGVVGVFFGAGVVITLGPEFVRTSLERRETDWFVLMALFGSGMLLGLLSAPFVRKKIDNLYLFPAALAIASVLAIVTAWVPTFHPALLTAAVLGVAAGLSFVSGYTLLHENTSDRLRARTFAAFYMGTRTAMFLALGLAPFIAGAIGRGTLDVGEISMPFSGIRITMFLGGAVALWSTVVAGRGMVRAERE